jgi:hypothetical protein
MTAAAAQSSNHIFLTNLNPLLSIGSKRSLTIQDIPPILEDTTGALVYKRFLQHWSAELLLPLGDPQCHLARQYHCGYLWKQVS